MKFILFYLPSVGTLSQTKQGMAGINSQNYQNMLWQVSEQIKFADRAGFWGAAFTEHHFHIEGIEESNNPILLELHRRHGVDLNFLGEPFAPSGPPCTRRS